ncbi:NADAR family protein [Seonamhaeicola marinus]|uniref:NADAR family protein n=1 Tax=Seonamhaeicola marinus TaxID=1912246 RepID=A0A5D0I5F5_9FLAO|nr:NADAR family protein [Seonamhaeicola marinus]TYA78608.1 NADAR family protein [Seonamhaeicola marinus]
MKYTRQQLIADFEQQERIKFLFFWGHTPNKDGSIGKSCFSQWWEAGFVVDGIAYKTAEHWMMAEKARLFNDEKHLAEIIKCNSPAAAKQLGRKVFGFNPEKWNALKYDIVKQGNLHKFSQNENLKSFLLNTENLVLVEASPRDRIWGIGMGESNEKAENPHLWRGENLLGFALMEVRDELNIKHNL